MRCSHKIKKITKIVKNYESFPSIVLGVTSIDLMHNDVTRLDAREECWS
jgi:hypothetical protein